MAVRRFSHWLTRQVGYEAMLVADRRVLHRRCAEAIESSLIAQRPPLADGDLRLIIQEEQWRSTARAEAAGELGRHWELGDEGRRAGLLFLVASAEEWGRSRFVEALSHAVQARKLLGAAGDGWGEAQAEQECGNVLRRQGRYAEAAETSGKALTAFRASGSERSVASALCGIGWVRANRGEYEAALENFEEALSIGRRLGDARGVANALNEIGGVHVNHGNYAAALATYGEALAIERKSGNARGVAVALYGIAIVHAERGEHASALLQNEEALAIFRQSGDARGAASVLASLGWVHGNRGEYETALAEYGESVGIYRRIGDARGVAGLLGAIGSTRRSLGEYGVALTDYLESLAMSRGIGDARGIANALLGLGGVRHDRGELAEALVALDESEMAASRLRLADVQTATLAERSIVRFRAGDPVGAREDAERAVAAAGSYAPGRAAARISLAVCTGDARLALQAAEEARAEGLPYVEAEALVTAAEILLQNAPVGETDGQARGAASKATDIARGHGMLGLLRRAEVLLAGDKPGEA